MEFGCVLSESQIRGYLRASPPLVEGVLDGNLQVQPNGIDLSLRGVQTYLSAGQLGFGSEERILPPVADLAFQAGWVNLLPGAYLITFNEIVHLPKHLMALGRPRSSLLRMGVTVETAVWDAGYEGRSQSLLVVHNPQGVRLAQNARLLQLVFFEVKGETKGYAGAYQRENLDIPAQGGESE